MKSFLVIGNPIDHSLSPRIHNHWIKKNNLDANYDKRLKEEKDLGKLILDLREEKIHGINVTVPFKKKIIPFLDQLSEQSQISQSVNTIYKNENKIIGDNTDIFGFETSLKKSNQTIKNKKVLILGAGGVVPSIIVALKKMQVLKIFLSNRTPEKALEIKKMFSEVETLSWGDVVDFDIIINATSIGLNPTESINLNYKKISKNKFFYDVIYNPSETDFLKKAREFGAHTENGKMMFIYQALEAFKIWHGFQPEIDDELIKLLD